jgi:hypothetical protein
MMASLHRLNDCKWVNVLECKSRSLTFLSQTTQPLTLFSCRGDVDKTSSGTITELEAGPSEQTAEISLNPPKATKKKKNRQKKQAKPAPKKTDSIGRLERLGWVMS